MIFISEIICSPGQKFCLSVKTQFIIPALLCPQKLNYDIVNLALSPSDSLLQRWNLLLNAVCKLPTLDYPFQTLLRFCIILPTVESSNKFNL